MSNGYEARAAPEVSDEVLENQDAEDCLFSMSITSENVAKDYNISRNLLQNPFKKLLLPTRLASSKVEIILITAKFIDLNHC